MANAAKLKDKLLVIVGELDFNVSPESNAAAGGRLQPGRKFFDMLEVSNAADDAASRLAQRTTQEFFRRNRLHEELSDEDESPVGKSNRPNL